MANYNSCFYFWRKHLYSSNVADIASCANQQLVDKTANNFDDYKHKFHSRINFSPYLHDRELKFYSVLDFNIECVVTHAIFI